MVMIPSDTKLPFPFERKQFPIIPAFSITINKSQGQTFNYVGVDLSKDVFSHGQLYVAVSRCRSSETLKFDIPIFEDMIPNRNNNNNQQNNVHPKLHKKVSIENDHDFIDLFGEDGTVSVKNVVYQSVLQSVNKIEV